MDIAILICIILWAIPTMINTFELYNLKKRVDMYGDVIYILAKHRLEELIGEVIIKDDDKEDTTKV